MASESRRSTVSSGSLAPTTNCEDSPLVEESSRWIYMGPEVFLHGRQSKAMDVYSYGMLLYEIFYGRQPLGYHSSPLEAALSASTCGERPHLCDGRAPPSINHIIQRCWLEDPGRRPSFVQIISWLRASQGDILTFRAPGCLGCLTQ